MPAPSPAATSRRCCSAACRAESKVLLLDDPTRGVDVGAKSEIYLLNRWPAGRRILFISSELPEVLGIADRVLVMRDGRIVG